MKLAFIGGGAMAEAMIAGVLRNNVAAPGGIAVSDVADARRKHLQSAYGVSPFADNAACTRGADLVVLAVKPQNAAEVLANIKDAVTPKQAVLSIMAGVTIAAITRGLGKDAVVRAMPNTPGQIGAGMTVWTATSAVTAAQRDAAAQVLSALGKQFPVPEEKYLDVATAVNGSGPAYAFLFIEALIDAGVYLGLARDLARELAVQTVLGSATMVAQSGQHPAVLRDMVASPGGTTVEALLVLEDQGLRATVMKAVIAAYRKSKSLGEDSK